MVFRKRSFGFGMEQLEARRPLAADVAGVLGEAACILVENSGADAPTSLFAEVDDGIFLAAGDEVWKSNGDQSAVLIKQVPGRIANGAAVNNRFLFTIETGEGFSGEDSVELWVSDGTESGTTKLDDVGVWDFFGQQVIVDYESVGEMVLMTVTNLTPDEANAALWTSDGTADNTISYDDGFAALWELAIHDVAELNGDWYFVSRRGLSSNFGLWKTDPVARTTELVRSFNDPPFETFVSGVFSVATTIGDAVYFSANDGETDYELWKSDGTPEGTVLVADINPNPPEDSGIPGGSSISMLTDVDGRAFFTADDGEHGRELWTSDGTAEGTQMVADLDRAIDGMAAMGDKLYFNVRGETPLLSELWSSDGTEAGTSLIAKLPGRIERSTAENSTLLVAGENVFFRLDDGINGVELWVSDGTSEGTLLAADINPGAGHSSPGQLTATSERLLFLANDGGGIDLWCIGLDDGVGSTGSPLPGDANGNGEVEFQDFLTLALNFGEMDLPGGAADGDFDEDGDVDFMDFLVLAKNFGNKQSQP